MFEFMGLVALTDGTEFAESAGDGGDKRGLALQYSEEEEAIAEGEGILFDLNLG